MDSMNMLSDRDWRRSVNLHRVEKKLDKLEKMIANGGSPEQLAIWQGKRSRLITECERLCRCINASQLVLA